MHGSINIKPIIKLTIMITTQYDSTAIFIAAVEYVADTLFMFTECQAGVMCGRKVYTLHFILVLIPRPFTK